MSIRRENRSVLVSGQNLPPPFSRHAINEQRNKILKAKHNVRGRLNIDDPMEI